MTAAGGDRAREGVDHLQSAAIEVIGAVRAFLDVAEELVRDPETVADAVRAMASMAVAAPPSGRNRHSERTDGRPAEPEPSRVRRVDLS